MLSRSGLIVAVLLLLQGCSPMPIREWPALNGRVLDAQTGEPIEGAFVVAHWIGYGGYSQSQCFHVEAVQTDAQGLFRIPEWRNEQRSATLSDQRRSIDVVYKPGYRFAERTYQEQSQKQGVWYLEMDRRDVRGRLDYLLSLANHACFSEEYKNLIPLNDAIYREAKEIARTEEQEQIADRTLFYLNVLRYGWDEAFKMKH